MSKLFVGRKKELALLNSLLSKKSSSLVVVKGRRRVGKSRLLREFGQKFRYLEFSGLAPGEDVTPELQMREFAYHLSHQTNLPFVEQTDWSVLFDLLASQCEKGRVVVLLDEISWMADGDPSFLPKLKNAWDMKLKHNPNLILAVCGSVSTWIEENIASSTGYFGRVSLHLTIEELSIPESIELLNAVGFKRSLFEQYQLLALTGGIPWYLEQVRKDRSANDNIALLCFNKNALLLNEFKYIFHDLFGKRSGIYEKIVKAISQNDLTYDEIADKIDYAKGSVLTEYIDALKVSGYISSYTTWNFKSTNTSEKLSKYRLSDNFLRFYFRYMSKRLTQIKAGRLDEVSPSGLPGWEAMLGLQFENLVLKNELLILKALHIRPEDVLQAGAFRQTQTARQKGCQIDLLIQTKYKTLLICEIKFSTKTIGQKVQKEVEEKINRLSIPRGYSAVPVLICAGEVSDALIETEYFSMILDMSDLDQLLAD